MPGHYGNGNGNGNRPHQDIIDQMEQLYQLVQNYMNIKMELL